MTCGSEQTDLLIIGAGQAGLALGHAVRYAGFRFLLAERNHRIGDSWRCRHHGLRLFTPRRFSALPGWPLSGDPSGFPSKDEIADYLESYNRHFNLPTRTGTAIHALSQQLDGSFMAEGPHGVAIRARAVAIATGAFQAPAIPGIAATLPGNIVQLTAAEYRNPEQLAPGKVLIVGDGATGRQIAIELAPTRSVTLATGHRRPVLPDHILGQSIFWWLELVGLDRVSPHSMLGRRMQRLDAFPGRNLTLRALRAQGIRLSGRLTGADGGVLMFTEGPRADIDIVLWATGYRDETSWVTIPAAKDLDGNFLQRGGVSPVPGLYFIGRSWQTSRGSALLMGVAHDARLIGEQVRSWLQRQP